MNTCPVLADEARYQLKLAAEDRFERQLDAIEDLYEEAANARHDKNLSRVVMLKIMRLRLEEALEKVKEMEG